MFKKLISILIFIPKNFMRLITPSTPVYDVSDFEVISVR
jgi:hypothetical protein